MNDLFPVRLCWFASVRESFRRRLSWTRKVGAITGVTADGIGHTSCLPHQSRGCREIQQLQTATFSTLCDFSSVMLVTPLRDARQQFFKRVFRRPDVILSSSDADYISPAQPVDLVELRSFAPLLQSPAHFPKSSLVAKFNDRCCCISPYFKSTTTANAAILFTLQWISALSDQVHPQNSLWLHDCL